ncbi:MAG: outer membrane beta-barrel protein, partial [Deltaproteobacteria bacterium]|nr:outer membrane beta-barrel protein [Deltaproteobacteria bacterium]
MRLDRVVTTLCLGTLLAVGNSPASADETRLLRGALYGDATEVPVDVRGWVSGGYTLNADYPDGNFNGPLGFNDRSDIPQMNQAYVIVERALDATKDEYQLGGRVDFVYGTDAAFTQTVGLDTHWTKDEFYKTALPQMYIEGFAPVMDGVRLKLGHFYTPIGYEVVT